MPRRWRQWRQLQEPNLHGDRELRRSQDVLGHLETGQLRRPLRRRGRNQRIRHRSGGDAMLQRDAQTQDPATSVGAPNLPGLQMNGK